ncbi:MAG: competence/damage-inducible protein A [Deltaproteobacteria bacterium]|nr:competence/damage-inducible protein A [Deltaproteobacteria bacterium]
MQPPTAAMLLIGNELLSGKIQDQNLVVLARDLRSLGVRLARVVMVEDDVETIAREVRGLSSTHDWLFTSGGVGPTHDDVTLEAVARAFEVKIERRPELESLLRGIYGERCTEGHLRMADLPEGAELVSEMDHDPDIVEVQGRKLPWPATLVKNVFVLPGIPQIFQMKLSAVRARLRKLGARAFVSHAVFTDMDEGHLKPLLDAVVERFPDIAVGSYPTWAGASYRTKLTFDGLDVTRVMAAADAFCATLPEGEPKRRE